MKKLNNKGFSLVELIIVIAIMVILVAVLAPQFTKWVERSRVSTDIQTASEIATAVEVAYAEGKTITSGVVNASFIANVDSIQAVPTTKAAFSGAPAKGSNFSVAVDTSGGKFNVSVYGGSSTTDATLQLYPTIGTKYAPYTNESTTDGD